MCQRPQLADWTTSATPNYDLGNLWVGITKFRLRPVPLPCPTPTAMATDLHESGLDAEAFPSYSGDEFPDHWPEARKAQARHYYRAIPEEFYTKSGRRPITPKNVKAWMQKASGRGLRFQFWEMCSGSGRLSLCLLLAQFMVGFPIDYRYSWDIGYPAHQALLQQAHQAFVPDHVFASPSCTPWSIASSGKDKAKRDEERRAELPTLEFLHDISLSQHNQDRGFTLEQPRSSAMLRESPVAELINHAGVRIQRMDQCMLGAQDECQRPIKKTTAFLSNRRWRRTLKRCNGHKGLPHGELQGRFKGCCRTALAAVYPKRMAQLMGQDLWAMLRADKASHCPPWPRTLFWAHGIYYTCERCQLGRAAPSGCEHTMVPGECRYGQPSMRQARARPEAPPRTSTTTPTAPTTSDAVAPSASVTPRMARSDLEDITGPFKFLARSGDYSRVQLQVHPSLTIKPESQLYLKAAMMQLIESCIDIFQASTSKDYDHWVSDPVLLRVYQDVFQDILNVLGVLVSLRPWQRKVPDPYLSSACAPPCAFSSVASSGPGRCTTLRTCGSFPTANFTPRSRHLFGFCSDDMEVDRAVPGSASASSRPAAPMVPVEKENGGGTNASSSPAQSSQRPRQQPPDADPVREDDAEQGEEDFEAVRPGAEEEPKTLRPLFDFKKVYKRLQSDIVQRDPVTAKRLLLGLHERFYHCPITDFKNMLLRAGLSSEILPLAEEAVMSCSVCRKYVRLPNRPQVKIGSAASSFNHRVQVDLFMHKETWILLNVDEATRYKTAMAVKSREHQELLNSMFDSWFSVFGPPAQLVMDQETSLMGHEAGRELERFCVERVPKGTTAGPAGQQHTGTGLVERHVGLMEITMLKLEAELDRQGIAITVNDLAKESAMSHNLSLNYGGATPSMCVFGVIPRPFYQDDSSGVTAVVGALQTDVTPFERAIRIRQMALSMVQRAVAEDRIARANRTRTQQLQIGEMMPGVTRVDFHRETQGDIGWRGPAELLKINKEEGTAILSYQGRPYLVSLRHIRPHQAGVFVVLNKDQIGDMMEVKAVTEKLSLYKVTIIGWMPEKKGDLTMWRRSSTSSLAYVDVWPKITRLASGFSRHAVGGIMMGQGVRQLQPPPGSCGVLIFWNHGASEHSSLEHNDDKPITVKKITTAPIDKVCLVYFYFFVNVEYRPEVPLKVVPSEGAAENGVEVTEPTSSGQDSSPTSPMSITSDPTSRTTTTSSMEEVTEDDNHVNNKRKGPDSRTVVLAPEAKRGRLGLLLECLASEKVLTKAQHNLVNLYWSTHWCQAVPTDFPMIWYGNDNNVQLAQWDIYMSRTSGVSEVPDYKKRPFLFTWPGKHYEELYADLHSGEIYKVDDEADTITEEECYDIWPEVEEADSSEIKQFVETSSFRKAHVSSLTDDTVIVDSVWVRKWKRMPDGSRKVKSRLCARGCFDQQKDLLTTRSTTATRLSQRTVLSVSANEDLDAESWDISGAFLKGLSFERVRELLRARGVTSPVRRVAIVAPANVWRHLATHDPKFRIDFEKIGDYVLFCLKPVYGLSDAPLAWQLCLHGHFEAEGGTASKLDENLFFWRDERTGRATSVVTTHVDDCCAGGRPNWLSRQLRLLQEKFGKVTRQTLPFSHCGMLYERIPEGFRMTQDSFAAKLKPAEIDGSRKDDEILTPTEVTMFRSILGGLLWLTATRLDLIAEVCLLQAQVTRAKVAHLRQANSVVRRARQEVGQGMGLYFQKLRGPLRLACIHDSSAAGNVRNYAQEGVLVLLCEDRLHHFTKDCEHILDDRQCQYLGGRCHILWAHGAKAKRISYSTSHAETLAAVSGLEAGTLVSVRLAELLYSPKPPTIQSLTAQQERGVVGLPIDSFTDCRDFFELASGDKNVPQDKNQRLYVLSFREAGMSGRIRWMGLIPTESMTADALTKTMIAEPMMKLLTTGTVEFRNQEKHHVTLRALPVMDHIEERHFDMDDRELIKELSKPAIDITACVTFVKPRFLCMALLATTSSATPTTATPSTTTSEGDDGWKWIVTVVIIVIATERLLCETARLWWRKFFNESEADREDRLLRKRKEGWYREGHAKLHNTPDDKMDVDDAHLDTADEDVDTYVDDKSLRLQLRESEASCVGLGQQLMDAEHEAQTLRTRLQRLEDQLRVSQLANQNLRAERDLLIQQQQAPPNELFATVATGRTFHRNRNCNHIRAVRVRQMRPCADCTG